jgi:hypothetical protein
LGDTAINKYGIPLEASDVTGDPRNARTGPASVAATAAKQDAWQGSIINEMGEDGNRFTPKVMSDTAKRTGQVYDDIATRTTIGKPATDNLVHNDLAAIEANLDNVAGITDSDRAVIKRNLNGIVDAVKPDGTISGADYRALTKTNSPLDRLESNSNSEVAKVGSDIRDALDGAFAKSASPRDQAALSKNNYQYRIMKTVQDLAAKSPDGNIDPGQFMTKVATASRRFDPTLGGMAYTGGGNIGELARIGVMMDTTPKLGPRSSVGGALARIATEAAPGVGYALAARDPRALVLSLPAAVDAGVQLSNALRARVPAQTVVRNALNPPPPPYLSTVPAAIAGSNPLMPPR